MGADLNNIVKFQKLSDEHVQFLIYQLLRGLKVAHCVPFHALSFHANVAETHFTMLANSFTHLYTYLCLILGRLFGLNGCHGADKSSFPLVRVQYAELHY